MNAERGVLVPRDGRRKPDCDTMLYFDCPHCGNHLRLEDEFAGRDGWCRACKGMIVAPTPGRETAGIETLSLEIRYNRLYHLFRFAATKADNYKLLLGRLRAQREALTQELAKAVKWRDSMTDLQRQTESMQRQLASQNDELAAAAEVRRLLESELEAIRHECETLPATIAPDLREAFEASHRQVEALEERLKEEGKETAALMARLSAAEANAAEAANRSDAAIDDLEQTTRDGQSSTDELRREISRLETQLGERDHEVSALREAHKDEVHALRSDVTSLQERLDAKVVSDQELEAERKRLEEQCATLEQAARNHEVLQTQLDTLQEDYALLEQEYNALQEDLDVPTFGSLPEDGRGAMLSPMPPAPPDANGTDEHVIIPEIVMGEPDRPDPMVNALLRFLNKARENDEVG